LICNSFTTLIYSDKEAGIVFAIVAGTLSALFIAIFIVWTSFKKAWTRKAFLLIAIWAGIGIFLTY